MLDSHWYATLVKWKEDTNRKDTKQLTHIVIIDKSVVNGLWIVQLKTNVVVFAFHMLDNFISISVDAFLSISVDDYFPATPKWNTEQIGLNKFCAPMEWQSLSKFCFSFAKRKKKQLWNMSIVTHVKCDQINILRARVCAMCDTQYTHNAIKRNWKEIWLAAIRVWNVTNPQYNCSYCVVLVFFISNCRSHRLRKNKQWKCNRVSEAVLAALKAKLRISDK